MSKVLVTESNLQDIANAIRSKNEGTDTYRPGDMAAAILAIPVGGTLVSKTITQNGEYDPEDDNADGYSDVTVNVSNSYTAEDEGKVVSSGALVAQTSQTVTQNGTYDTTLINELIANISGGGGGGGIRYGTAFPDASTGEDGDVYLQISEAAVKNTAGQYISTGYSGNENSKYVIAFMLTKAQSSQWPTPFGARTGDVTNASLYSLAIAANNYSQSSAQWGNTATIATGFPGATALVDKMVVLEVAAGSEKMEVDGTVYTHTSTHSGTVNGTSSMGIFAALKNGAYQTWSPVDGMQLYSFDIYESDVLVHSYRPALDGNDVACIYDSVSDEYLYHSGGGTLQYIEDGTIIKVLLKVNGAWQALTGSDIDDVNTSGGGGSGDDSFELKNYLESSGTQYINTGYTIAANTRFEVVANVPDNSNQYPALFGERTSTSNEVVIFVEFRGDNIAMVWANGDSPFDPNFWHRGYIGTKCKYVLSAAGEISIRDADNYGFQGTRTTGTGASLPVYLFVLNENNSPNSITYCVAKLYRFRVYEGDALVMELLPFVDGNNVACLKDTVSGDLFYNSGSGSFIYGTDV